MAATRLVYLAAAAVLAPAALPGDAWARGAIKAEADKKVVRLDEQFKFAFTYPLGCWPGDLPKSPQYEIVETKIESISGLKSRGTATSLGSDMTRQTHLIRPKQAGTIVFPAVKFACGSWGGASFPREVLVLPGAGARPAEATAAAAPPPQNPDDMLFKPVSIQNMRAGQPVRRPPPEPGLDPRDTGPAAPVAAAPPSAPLADQAPPGPPPEQAAAEHVDKAARYITGVGSEVSRRAFHWGPGLAAAGAALVLGWALLLAVRKTRWWEETRLATRAHLSPSAGSDTAAHLGGKYQVEMEIGSGGMGKVFLAKDVKLGRRVAVKEMNREHRFKLKDRERFLQEARLISQLTHPYIVAIHEILEADDALYLVFEYVDGKTLSRVIDDRKKLSLKECQRVFSFVCQAVEHAHKNNVLHLDLKPGNIMIDRNGYARVMDFGLARQLGGSTGRASSAGGTGAYMAPEQHVGDGSPASDVYSLAVCLYESLTGQVPFKGPEYLREKELLKYIPATTLIPELPAEIDALVAKCLVQQPGRRLATTAEFIAALRAIPA